MPGPTFNLDKDLFDGQPITLTAEATNDPDVLVALAENQPFPDETITLGDVQLTTAQPVAFSTKVGSVGLRASGGGQVFAGLGLYTDPQQLLSALAANPQMAPALDFGSDAASRYLLWRMGYDLHASARAALPLNTAGSVSFGADGKTTGLFAVIHRFPATTGARTVMTDTAASVRLPMLVNASDDLAPGTWIVMEVEGSVGVQLGATLGFNFNWVRQLTEGTLSGDIGLRLQVGIAATLGFSAAGSYLVVLNRPADDAALRLRLFKSGKKGWSFGFNLNSTVQGQGDGLPERFDDFVSAIFGVNGQQVLHDLQDLERWTDPNQSLPDLLSGAGVDYAKKLVQDLTGIDPEQAFDEAKGEITKLLTAWQNLPAKVTAVIMALVQDEAKKEGVDDELETLRSILQTIATATPGEVQALLEQALAKVDFFQTPLGQWLEAIAEQGVLALFDKVQFVQDIAAKTLQVLDGGTVQTLLVRLQTYIDEHLGINKIEAITNQTTFNQIDVWLKAKLSAFLGKAVDFNGVEKIRQTIGLLLSKRQVFYDKALAALNQQYAFSGAYTYQRTTTGTALLDVTFSGSQASLKALHQALGGDFSQLLTQTQAGVTLNTAMLTHGTTRQQHVEVALPFFKADIDHINQSLAQVKAVDNEDGRVLVYALNASDSVTRVNQRNSTLTLGANLPVKLGNQTRVFDADAFTFTYAFEQAVAQMRTGQLRYQLKPYITFYFPSEFSPIDNDAVKPSFDTWLTDLDKTLDRLETSLASSDLFGNTLLSLQLSLPGRVAAAWFKAPADEKAAAYMTLSRRLQRQLKQLIPFYFFQNVAHYDTLVPAEALLVYAAMPASTSVSLSGTKLTLNTNKDTYWNWPDDQIRAAMAQAGVPQLSANLARVQERLEAAGKGNTAKFYSPQAVTNFLNDSLNGHSNQLLESLLFVESTLIASAINAGRNLARFLVQSETNPGKAIAALEQFGSDITKTFNKEVRSVYGGGALRPLGTVLFVEAARAFDAEAVAPPRALLDLTVFKPNTPFPPANFPNYTPPTADEVVLQQRIVEVSR